MRAGHSQARVGFGLVAALALAAAGCGGTTGSSTGATTTATTTATTAQSTTTTTAAAPTTAQTKADITTTWTKFFAYSTPTATRLALLENGPKYAKVIGALTHLLPAGASATVQAVQASQANATVTYSLRDASGPLESNLTGAAIEVGGKWLVADSTFCGLVALAGSACPK